MEQSLNTGEKNEQNSRRVEQIHAEMQIILQAAQIRVIYVQSLEVEWRIVAPYTNVIPGSLKRWRHFNCRVFCTDRRLLTDRTGG